jgi:NAD(P)-dependent dehydrogenase (short-subunit alcohol dehydrogenase family)
LERALEGRIALVTGASRGIGVGIAKCLAAEGARVALAARSREGLDATRRAIESGGGSALCVPTDVSREDQVRAMLAAVESAWGPVELLVNNAGVHGDADWSERFPEETRDWEAAFRVNTLSRVWACEAALPSMKARRFGRIVNVSSVAGLEGQPAHVAYNATRAAEISYTQALAREVGAHGITVNAILPGLVETDMAVSLWKHIRLRFGEQMAGPDPKTCFDRLVETMIPLRRAQTAEDIGWLAAFLCSERGRNISGQAINVDGGMRVH